MSADAMGFFRKNTTTSVCAGAVIVFILLALFSPLIAPCDPLAVDLECVKKPPSARHWFGTDEKGRDIFSRVIYGARFSLAIGLLATALALVIGTAAGLIGGYFGGKADAALQALTDVTLAFPSLLLAIAITIVLSPGFVTVFLALGLVGWAAIARLVRGEVMALKGREFVMAARAGGSSPARILLRHILPNCLPLILVAGSLKIGAAILGEAALSFLDLGVRPPAPTWGSMISSSREFLSSAPWMAIFPGIFLSTAVIVSNLLGDSLRDWLDPRLGFRRRKINQV
ncbi:MAG: ABC transporter permease [Candidatus Aureabacteria bacterium]|nr:ABC transporter permease [Candidatus Auribacterota bacterium]